MWGGNQPAFVPDSLDDDDGFQVVYGDERHEGAGGPESQQAARAGRPRYALPQASSAVKPAARSLAAAEAAAAAQQQHPASPTLSGGPPPREAPPSPGAPAADAPQQPPLALAQELQTVLSGLSPQHQAPAAGWGGPVPQVQAAAEGEPGGLRARQRTGPRQNALHNSPAAPAAAAAAGGAAGTAGGSRFFAVDADLLQAHAQRQAVAAAPPGQGRQQRRQPPPQQQAQRTVQWDSPQALLPAEHTPLPSQRPNPLAALLGGGSVPHPRQATTGSRMRGRHPIYGAAAATAAGGATAAVASVETGGAAAGAAAASTGDVGSSGSRLREMGFRDAPLNSPRQLQQQQQQQPRRPLPQQQQHTRFAIRDVQAVPASSAAAAADVAASQQHQQPPAAAAAVAVPGAAAGLRLLTGSEPASALRQQQFQPRPPRPPSPGEGIEEEPQQEQRWQQQQQDQQQAWQQQQQQQAWGQQRQGWGQPQDAAAEAAGDGFRTPGQPLRRSRQEEEWQQPQQPQQQQQQQQQQGGTGGSHLGAPGAAAAGTGGRGIGSGERGAPGSTGGKQMSLQRQFVAQLQPVSRPAAAATMQQQRQRLAGAAGLHARMQAILAAEKAGLQAGGQSPTGGQPGAGPRLTVLQKELEGSITKLHCRCDTPAAAAFGAAEVAAFLQSRTAREVDTTPGSVILLREPWRIVPLVGSPLPVVLCFAASEG